VECTAIAQRHLGGAFDVQGGGRDLVFPHHEMCAGHAQVAVPGTPFAQVYSHGGMVGYDGEKMSKSRGNLVFVSALRNSDVDPMAIRLALLRHHFRSDWEWTDDHLWTAVDDIARWRRALSLGAGAPAAPVVEEVLAALADDLDAPRATAAVDRWVAATLGTDGLADTSDPDAGVVLLGALDAALGLALWLS
jgi:L-cysteine:1D-myo-inositol 2-amino-2-deoxy-alpha-D-glucopyranoside ligase